MHQSRSIRSVPSGTMNKNRNDLLKYKAPFETSSESWTPSVKIWTNQNIDILTEKWNHQIDGCEHCMNFVWAWAPWLDMSSPMVSKSNGFAQPQPLMVYHLDFPTPSNRTLAMCHHRSLPTKKVASKTSSLWQALPGIQHAWSKHFQPSTCLGSNANPFLWWNWMSFW